MSIFDSLAGGVLKSVGGDASHPGLAGEVLNMVGGGQGGGLAKLVTAFEGNGLGNVVQSWVSTGANLPVSADQIAQVLGSGPIAQLAAKFGLAPEDVASRLSKMLPQIVDGLTPHGSLPDSDALQEGLSLLRRHLG
jgi:uncharacterized protein YidB (DUF937 family)